jgi:ribosome-binding factor A
MSSLRQKKINTLLKQELSLIFREESRTVCLGAMVTVTVVNIAPDMTYAKVYISVFGGKNDLEVYENVKRNSGYIRGILGTRLGKSLRRIPDLDFKIDDSIDYANKIDELLKG